MAGNPVSIKVQGLRELGERLRALSRDMALKTARGATAAAAGVVRKRAQALAPIADAPHPLGRRKGQLVQPGNLRKNIYVRRVPPQQTPFTSEHLVTVRQGSGKAGRDAFYGRFIEFGTVKMRPQPFLRPALASERGKALETMKKRLASGIARFEKGSGR
jgi:HK97 gp10 family phage protein